MVNIMQNYIGANGSFTLSSGQPSDYPMVGSSSISMVKGGVNSFVSAAALEVDNGVRINAVSPGWVKETMEAMGMDSRTGIPTARMALANKESIESNRNGEILDISMFN